MTIPLTTPLALGAASFDPAAFPYRFSTLRPIPRPRADLDARLPDVLRQPTAGPPLAARAPAVVIVPDATRATFVRPMVEAAVRHLLAGGLAPADLHLLLAGGLHRAPTPEELAKLLGPEVHGRFPLHLHDADDPSLPLVGTTRRGTPVHLPRLVMDARTLVVIGGITPHYFAGWTGGMKGLVPGAAGRPTITANHRRAVAPAAPTGLHPACREGSTRGNPVHEDYVEAGSFAPAPFLLNVVLGRDGEPRALVSGEPRAAHRAGVRAARRAVGVRVHPVPLAIVAAGDPGRERDWIQAHKIVRQGAACVADGGTLIALAACTDGVGSPTLLDWFEVDPARLAAEVAARYTLHGHTALAMRALTRRIRVLLVTTLAPQIVERMGMTPAPSLEAALAAAAPHVPVGSPALVIPRAGTLLPLTPAVRARPASPRARRPARPR
jgi:nickel-dependent lactate racemase